VSIVRLVWLFCAVRELLRRLCTPCIGPSFAWLQSEPAQILTSTVKIVEGTDGRKYLRGGLFSERAVMDFWGLSKLPRLCPMKGRQLAWGFHTQSLFIIGESTRRQAQSRRGPAYSIIYHTPGTHPTRHPAISGDWRCSTYQSSPGWQPVAKKPTHGHICRPWWFWKMTHVSTKFNL